MKKTELKDRVYILKSGKTPPSFTIQSRNSHRRPLLWFDEEKKQNRALRYAKNQKSPFEDEQDNHAILEPITFFDGVLEVPRTNPVLQQFLAYHPDNGEIFIEKDEAKQADERVDEISLKVKAQSALISADISTLIPIAKILLGSKLTNKLTSRELLRDLLIYAERDAEGILEAMNDPDSEPKSIASDAIAKNFINWRAAKRELYYNFQDNKKKLMSVPVDMEPEDALFTYLKSEDGAELYAYLEKIMH